MEIDDDKEIEKFKVLSYINIALIYERINVFNKAIDFYNALIKRYGKKINP